MAKSLKDKLEDKIQRRGKDECWLWTGATIGPGYGVISHENKMVPAHRAVYRLHHGRIPPTQKVLRTCLNQLCCNPSHLILGSLADAHALLGIQRNDLRRGSRTLTSRQRRRIKERALRGDAAVRIKRDYPSLSYITVLRLVHEAVDG